MRKDYVFVILVMLMVTGCARMGQPDGGWFDDTPPKVVLTTPEDKSTEVNSRKINIYFDEYIKLDNPTENVIISPPQLEVPEIKAGGRRISVEILDTLIPNTTYTVDFSDAISDNNEGNPMGNYTYCFSTGEVIDTMEVSGYVVDAENMEPIKGILVGLYNNLADSAFTTQSMLRVARTDSRGHFIIKGVADGEYRIYALQDADNNYYFSQKSEKLAFNHDIIVPSCKPDIRQDTIWRDSLHIHNIIQTGYTHFLPDNIVLRAFNEVITDKHLLKVERKDPENVTMFFSYGDRTLPKIKGFNFDEREAFMLEASEHLDTLKYWLRDTTLVNQDTLRMEITYTATDTLGKIETRVDTMELIPKMSYEKRQKEKEKEREKWNKEQEKAKKKGNKYLTEMPPTPLDLRIQTPNYFMPNSSVLLESTIPIAYIDTTKIKLTMKVDTMQVPKSFLLKEVAVIVDEEDMEMVRRKYILTSDSTDNLWSPGMQYTLVLDSAAFTDIYGKASNQQQKVIAIKTEQDYTTITFQVTRLNESPYIGQLIDSNDKVVMQTSSYNGTLVFNYINPGTYFFRVIADTNNNGVWDTGEYANDLQAEMVYYYPEKIECKAHWPVVKSWNPSNLDTTRLKPAAITKQKPDKEKKLKNQNAERARKLGIPYIPKNLAP